MKIDKREFTTVAEEFKKGRTLKEIGKDYGVSREWIRRILKDMGLTGKDSGRRIKSAEKKASFEEDRDRRYLKRHGCTRDQFVSVCGRHGSQNPVHRYFRTQRGNAYMRGISWELSFWDWWCIWAESGKWEQRGRTDGKYVMCRNGDEGPYSKDNVYIGTVNHNTSTGRVRGWENGLRKSKLRAVVKAAGGRAAAAEALGVTPQHISCLCCTDYLPDAWIKDGRGEKLVDLTCGAYSLDDLQDIAESHQAKRGAV